VCRTAVSETVREAEEVIAMRLTARDAVASVFAGSATAIWALHVSGTDPLGIAGVRPLAGIVLGLGVGACLSSDLTTEPLSPRYVHWMASLGVLSPLAAMVALVSGLEIPLATPVVLTVAMWISATIRHFRLNPPSIDAEVLQAKVDAERRARAGAHI
jgi:hypothetical protein